MLLAPEEVSCESFCEVPRWHREAGRIQVARDDGPFSYERLRTPESSKSRGSQKWIKMEVWLEDDFPDFKAR